MSKIINFLLFVHPSAATPKMVFQAESQRSAQMLLDYDNMYRELFEAIEKYEITEVPELFKEEEPDHRALTYYRTEFYTFFNIQ